MNELHLRQFTLLLTWINEYDVNLGRLLNDHCRLSMKVLFTSLLIFRLSYCIFYRTIAFYLTLYGIDLKKFAPNQIWHLC